MIGYNERQEAENLLELLLASREKLNAFNAPDDDSASDDALLARYLPLAAWAVQARDSGAYALCFTPADKVQRMPYDLLARLPLRESETGVFEGPDALFAGLDTAENLRMRRLYHRLLGILPMRTLLERLLTLAALEGRRYDAPRLKQERLRLLRDPAWRAAIPLCQERRSGTKLQLQDHDFTILDRLIDNRGKTLREDAGFALPVAMMERTACPPALMTAAIALRQNGGETPAYQALPCGHTALGVYGTGTPESFFDEALRDQQRRSRPVLRVRAYGQLRLMQVDGEAAQLLRKTRYDAAKSALPMEERKLFGAADDGGRHILPQLSLELQARYELSDEACMCAFFKGEEQVEIQRLKAMRGLRAMAEAFFAQAELPKNFNNDDPALFINVGKKKLAQRAARLLIAHGAKDRLLMEGCPDGKIPPTLAALLDELEGSPQRRSAFLQDIRSMGESRTKLNVRYEGSAGTRMMLAVRSPQTDLTSIENWLQEGGTAVPAFTPKELTASCTYGLQRFLYYGQEVGTGAKQGDFSLSASTGARRAPDVCFQLLCLWCAAQSGGTATLHPHSAGPEKTFLRLRNGDVPFVELLAEAKTPFAFTPAAMAAFVPQLPGLRLKITRQGDVFIITC